MTNKIGSASLLVLLLAAKAAAQVPKPPSPVTATANGWQLVWSDEFNGTSGSAPNPANWNFDLGGGGWGNGELETYTNSANNVYQDGKGNLVISALKDAQGNYTSARLQTGAPGASTSTTDLSWQYGLIEARIKLPFGQGIWPAFWMLGEDIGTVSWPGCGEVDIMENFGTFNNNASVNNGTPHGPGFQNVVSLSAAYMLPFGETVYDDYHVYSIQWSPNSVVWYVDGASYNTLTPSSLPTGGQWVFNAPFFLLLNLAIGGPTSFLGTPDSTVNFPQTMLVDYVRVYQATTVPATTPVITPGRVVNAASYLGAISPGSLAVVYGNNLADAVHQIPGPALGQSFPTTVAGVSVSVNGVNAPLIYVSPTQINFQVPWETLPSLAVPVTVTWNTATSNIEPVTIASAASPSFFLSEFVNGVAWVTGSAADGCPTPVSECSVQPGSSYALWANGLGPMTSPLQDGVGAPLAALQVPGGPSGCQLMIGGQPATVLYCGVSPGEIIDQVNFTYPAGVSSTSPYVGATLTINGATSYFRVPAPAQ
ncbi:MAG: family 16 glycosylhydrolase [Bryobacteraceae bacterium]